MDETTALAILARVIETCLTDSDRTLSGTVRQKQNPFARLAVPLRNINGVPALKRTVL